MTNVCLKLRTPRVALSVVVNDSSRPPSVKSVKLAPINTVIQ